MTTARMIWSALQLTHKLHQLTHIALHGTAVTACHSNDASHVQVSILADERPKVYPADTMFARRGLQADYSNSSLNISDNNSSDNSSNSTSQLRMLAWWGQSGALLGLK